MWTKEIPTQEGWYWFYGMIGFAFWVKYNPELFVVRAWVIGAGKNRRLVFLESNEEFHPDDKGLTESYGLWHPMTVPEPPTV